MSARPYDERTLRMVRRRLLALCLEWDDEAITERGGVLNADEPDYAGGLQSASVDLENYARDLADLARDARRAARKAAR
jgi:hypothetical protein